MAWICCNNFATPLVCNAEGLPLDPAGRTNHIHHSHG